MSIRVVLVHNSESNNAQFMQKLWKHVYIETTHNITGRKNISLIFKDQVSWVKKTSLTKEVALFLRFTCLA